jgi:enterobacterial common antigen polymerase
MIFVLCTLNLLASGLLWAKYAKFAVERIYLSVFTTCYVFTYFGGLLIADALYSMLGIAKITASDEVTWRVIILSDLCLVTFICGYILAKPLKQFIARRRELVWKNRTKVQIVFLFGSFVVATLVYLVSTGGPVLFKEGGYENRYDANVGLGGYSLFFSMGLLGCNLLSLRAETRKEKRNALILTVLYCALTFIVLGGYRQLGFAALFSLGVISLIRKDIAFGTFAILSIILVISTLAVAMLRYTGNSAEGLGGIYGRMFIFLYDGFAPVDAFYNIVAYCGTHEISNNVIANQFSTMIPRFLWPEKPLVVLNSGNFYTQVVLGRSESITYSPTLLGELYLVGGATVCLLGTFISGVVLRVFDEIILRSKNKMLVAFFFSFAFVFVFNLYREGISVLVTKVILFGVATMTLLLASRFFVRKTHQ